MDSKSIKKAVSCLQSFFDDVALFYKALEEELAKSARPLIPHPLPKPSTRASWRIKDEIDSPDGWIAKDIHRVYVPQVSSEDSQGKSNALAMVMLSLYPREGGTFVSLFDVPALTCTWVTLTSELSYQESYQEKVWLSDRFIGITSVNSPWQAKPGAISCDNRLAVLLPRKQEDISIREIHVFAVDITTVENREKVKEKVISPLCALADGHRPRLDHALQFPQDLINSWQRQDD